MEKHTESLLLSGLRSVLFGTKELIELNDEVLEELKQHQISLLLLDHLPREAALNTAPILVHNIQLLYEQDKLIQLLKSHKIPVVVLKGTANAVHYPKPSYRPSGDIDLWVGVEHFDPAYTLMLENGYIPDRNQPSVEDLDAFGGKHIDFLSNNISIELHKKPFLLKSYVDSALEQSLMNFMEEGLLHASCSEVDGYCFPVLPPKQTSFELLIHIQSHLRTGIGLRQLLDWVMFSAAYLNDDSFPEYEELWKPYGLVEFAAILSRIGQLYLGLPQENCSWTQIAKKETCDALFHRILQFGNFGRKNGISGGTRVIMRTPMERLRMLHAAGLSQNRERIKRHPWMRRIAWSFQLKRYMSYVFHHGKDLRADYREAKVMKELLESLRLFEEEE